MAGSGAQGGGRDAAATADEAWQCGTAQWPGLRPSRARFAEQWVACSRDGAAPVFVEDLFLAHACLAGDPAALRIFDRTYIARVRSYVARFSLSPGDVAEVEQLVRVRLLTGPHPKLAQYTAAGPLARWMRVAVVRTAVNFIASRPGRPSPAEVEVEDALMLATADLPAAEQNLVNQLMTAQHRDLVREVLGEALAGLPDHEKTFLRMYLLDGVGVESIARVFSVHRATVARWFSSIRRRVLKVVNDYLSLRLGASASQVRSLFRELRFDLNLSMKRLLESGPAVPPQGEAIGRDRPGPSVPVKTDESHATRRRRPCPD